MFKKKPMLLLVQFAKLKKIDIENVLLSKILLFIYL